jgi:hypothetical protein
MRKIPPERNGWRDLEMSLRHKLWGFHCPAVDIDFLMVEYNRGQARGLYLPPTTIATMEMAF